MGAYRKNDQNQPKRKSDLKHEIEFVRGDILSLKTETGDALAAIRKTGDKTFNLVDGYVKKHEAFEQELTIMKARLERTEDKLGLRNIPL